MAIAEAMVFAVHQSIDFDKCVGHIDKILEMLDEERDSYPIELHMPDGTLGSAHLADPLGEIISALYQAREDILDAAQVCLRALQMVQ